MNKLLLTGIVLVFVPAVLLALFLAGDYGGGEIIYKLEDEEDAVFSHEFHTRIKGFDCADCHSAVFKMTRDNFKIYHDREEEIMSLFQEGILCGHCHNNSTAFTTEDNCTLCHP